MRTLHLLRHAKAVGTAADGTDHARPLAARGIRVVKALAAHLAKGNFHLTEVFCSTSQRTRETWQFIAPALPGVSIAFSDQLYLEASGNLMEFIRSLPDAAGDVMIIGHNPAFHETARGLARDAKSGHAEELAALKVKFPTGALCSLQFNVAHWREVKTGGGILSGFVRPSDLADD